MESAIRVQYRINAAGGCLYVRELTLGEIVTRIPSDLKLTSAGQQADVVRLCSNSFVGSVESVHFDSDCFYVTCAVPVTG